MIELCHPALSVTKFGGWGPCTPPTPCPLVFSSPHLLAISSSRPPRPRATSKEKLPFPTTLISSLRTFSCAAVRWIMEGERGQLAARPLGPRIESMKNMYENRCVNLKLESKWAMVSKTLNRPSRCDGEELTGTRNRDFFSVYLSSAVAMC